MTLDVTLAKPSHLDGLLEQDRHVSPDWVRRCLEIGEHFVAMSGDQPAGFLRFSWLWRTIPYKELIRVADDHRRPGGGRHGAGQRTGGVDALTGRGAPDDLKHVR